MVRFAYSAWIRNSGIEVDIPKDGSDADKEYAKFVESVFSDAEGGVGQLLEHIMRSVFFGWAWMQVVPGVRKAASVNSSSISCAQCFSVGRGCK